MRTVTAVLATFALATTACGRDAAPRARAVTGKDAGRLLIDRNWLDRWPTHKDEHLVVYRFVPSMGGGVFQDRTLFKGTFELFQFTADAGTIGFRFPHTDEQIRAHYHIERVTGPAPFDLKLTVDADPRGPGIYYGMTSDHGQDVETLLHK
jgi:hypothetical protein